MLLLLGLAALLGLDVGHLARLARAAAERRHLQAHAAVVGHAQRVVVAAAGAPEVRHRHERELEALRRVDRHQPHGVEPLSLERRLGLRARAPVSCSSTKSMKPRRSRPSSRSYSRARRISLRTFAIRRAALRHREDAAVVARARDGAVDQRLERRARRARALVAEACARTRASGSRSASGSSVGRAPRRTPRASTTGCA